MQLLAQQLALLRSSGDAGASPGLAFAVASAAQADAEAVSTAAAAAAIASVPVASSRTLMDAAQPLVPGARIGREPDGRPAWFVPNPDQPGKYLKVGT